MKQVRLTQGVSQSSDEQSGQANFKGTVIVQCAHPEAADTTLIRHGKRMVEVRLRCCRFALTHIGTPESLTAVEV